MEKHCFTSTLPDGEIKKHKWIKPKGPLKKFGKLIKSSKSMKEIKKEILETAMEQVEA